MSLVLLLSLGFSALAADVTPVKVHITSGDKDQIDYIVVIAQYDGFATPVFTSNHLTPVASNNLNQWDGVFDGKISDNSRNVVGSVTIYWKTGGTSVLPFHESAVGGGGNATLNITIASAIAPTYSYKVQYAYFTSTDNAPYVSDGTGTPVTKPVVATAPLASSVFTDADLTSIYNTFTYAKGTAITDVSSTGTFIDGTLVFTVNYYRSFTTPTFTYQVQYAYFTSTDNAPYVSDGTGTPETLPAVATAPLASSVFTDADLTSIYNTFEYAKGTATTDVSSTGTFTDGTLVFTVNYYRSFTTPLPGTYAYKVQYAYFSSTDNAPYVSDGTGAPVTQPAVATAPLASSILTDADLTSDYSTYTYAKGTETSDVSSTGTLIDGTLVFTVNYYRSFTTPQTSTYGSLKVIKQVSPGTSTTEKFRIDVAFNLEGSVSAIIENQSSSDVIHNNDGSYTIYLAHDEYVIFKGLIDGTIYTVNETITEEQSDDGWYSTTGEITDDIGYNDGLYTHPVVTIYNSIESDEPTNTPAPTPTPTPVINNGTLSVAKNVTGDGASTTEKFDITVTFAPGAPDFWNVNGISAPAGATGGGNGTYKLSLSAADGPVTFTNIPVGTIYTVTETIKNNQENDGWAAGTSSGTSGTISAAGASATVMNVFTQPGEVAGASDKPDVGVAGDSDSLPQTGGISFATLLGFLGLALIAAGGTTILIFRKRNDGKAD